MRRFIGRERDVALSLLKLGAVQFGAFKLKLHEKNPSAPLSPIYFNLRTSENPKPGPLTQEAVDDVALLMYGYACMFQLEYQHVVGVPRAGEPFAEAFVRAPCQQQYTLLKLGKEETSKGRRVAGMKEGAFNRGDRVLVLDDLVTEADTKLEAIAALEEAGLRVSALIVLLDREQGGSEELARRGYTLHSIFTLSGLLSFYLQERALDLTKYDEVKAYLKASRTV